MSDSSSLSPENTDHQTVPDEQQRDDDSTTEHPAEEQHQNDEDQSQSSRSDNAVTEPSQDGSNKRSEAEGSEGLANRNQEVSTEQSSIEQHPCIGESKNPISINHQVSSNKSQPDSPNRPSPAALTSSPHTPAVISAAPVLSSSYHTSTVLNGLTPANLYTPTTGMSFASGPLLSRATHPSVMRKDLAKEGVIRLFCGGLSFESDESTLSEYFQRYGVVVDARIAREASTNRHRGFGFVAVRTPRFDPDGSEESNLQQLDELKRRVFGDAPHEIQNRRITVQEENRAGEGPKVGTPSTGGGRYDYPRDGGDGEYQQEPRVFVANLESTWDQTILKDYFSQFGEVVEVHIVTDANGISRNFAFVTFGTTEAARKVCDGPLDWDPSTNKRRRSARHVIRGREVTVREADPKRGRARQSPIGVGLGHHPGMSHHGHQQYHHPSATHAYGSHYGSGTSGTSPSAWGYSPSTYGGSSSSNGASSDPQMQQMMAAAAVAAYGNPQAYFQGMMMMPPHMFHGQGQTGSTHPSSSQGSSQSWAGYYTGMPSNPSLK